MIFDILTMKDIFFQVKMELNFKNQQARVPGKPFELRLMFVGKALPTLNCIRIIVQTSFKYEKYLSSIISA